MSFEHLIDPASTLRSLFPRVREGGMLLFETPDGGFSVRRAVLGLHRFSAARIDLTRSMFYWEHRIYFTERGFRQLMQRLGCEVVAVAAHDERARDDVGRLRGRSGAGRPSRPARSLQGLAGTRGL